MSVVINGSAGVTTNSGAVYDSLQRGTAVASTSGTSVDFTSIPSWVKRITLIFSDVSLSGSDNLLIQIGDSGGLETTGYLGAGGYTVNASSGVASNFTAGWGIVIGTASGVFHGTMQIVNLTGNTWVSSSSGAFSNAAAFVGGGGNKTLSAQLDRVSVTRTGTNTFDAGTINIIYE